PRFPASAAGFGRVRTDVDRIDGSVLQSQQLPDTIVDRVHPARVEIATPDPRLIRDDRDSEACLAQPPKRRGGTVDQYHRVRIAQVVFLDDERPVAIDEDES